MGKSDNHTWRLLLLSFSPVPLIFSNPFSSLKTPPPGKKHHLPPLFCSSQPKDLSPKILPLQRFLPSETKNLSKISLTATLKTPHTAASLHYPAALAISIPALNSISNGKLPPENISSRASKGHPPHEKKTLPLNISNCRAFVPTTLQLPASTPPSCSWQPSHNRRYAPLIPKCSSLSRCLPLIGPSIPLFWSHID